MTEPMIVVPYGEGPYGVGYYSVGPVAERVVEALGETFISQAGDQVVGFVDAYTHQLDPADGFLTQGELGWWDGFDLDLTPDPGWLARFVGARLAAGLNGPAIRAAVKDRAAWRRGTPAAMQAAVAALLTGDRNVTLHERVGGDAYALTVRVYVPEVPAGVVVGDIEAAALPHKPAGIVMTCEISAAASYAHFAAEHGPTYADAAAEFPTYAASTPHVPEGGTTP